MEGKRYVRLLRPKRHIPFTCLMVYSFLYSRLSRRRSYTQALIARTLGLDKNTVLPARRQLVQLGLVEVTARRRLRAKLPPPDWFRPAKAGPALSYTRVYLPTHACPLTSRQNAVYWLIESFRATGGRVFVKGIATMLGINLKTVKSSLRRIRGYKPLPEHYLDTKAKLSPMQIAAYTDDERLRAQMSEAGYSKDQIVSMFRQVPDTTVLRLLFDEAQKQNDFAKYRTSHALLAYKVESYLRRPKPETPPTWEELQRKMSEVSDPLEFLTPDYFGEHAYVGRVNRVPYREHRAFMKEYGAECILQALQALPHLPHDLQAQLPLSRFKELLEQAKAPKQDTVN